MIRPGTHDDVGALVDLGRRLAAESPRFSRLAYSETRVEQTIAGLIENPAGLVLVSSREGRIIGGILAMATPHWSSDDVVAQEISLFVAPEARGGLAATQLICGMVAWAQDKGARWLQAGTSTGVDAERTIALYERLGFRRCAMGLEVVYGL